MAEQFEGKVVLLTGGAHGIGRATAIRFAEAGASVTVCDVQEDKGQETVSLIEGAGGRALFVRCDVTSAADCEAAVNKTVETFGGIDVLFNNAGITRRADVVETTEEEWDAVMAKSAYTMSAG